ncbi:hypothetical protein [uncultured Desulfuromonas sp.]|uniref:hypothetical protein n=1 Tax=uncultured Desulfuromonas sp. TaxID=181013 RepID=UPI002AABE15F|nr:hypothetical protein [uncultured Desulfuromonas sp.]
MRRQKYRKIDSRHCALTGSLSAFTNTAMSAKLAQSASVLKQVADDHRADRSLRSALLNGRAWLLNNTRLKGGHRPARFIGATPEIEHDLKLLSTSYTTGDELHDSST